LFILLTCWLFIKRQWTVGGIAYALALGVKMNALLYFPGILTVITLAGGLERAFRVVILIIELQVIYFREC
jgi:predicted membrane-bound dolichyl-phosphate-mannose-protein mannosyltransferase